jgi:hypothetical protein
VCPSTSKVSSKPNERITILGRPTYIKEQLVQNTIIFNLFYLPFSNNLTLDYKLFVKSIYIF